MKKHFKPCQPNRPAGQLWPLCHHTSLWDCYIMEALAGMPFTNAGSGQSVGHASSIMAPKRRQDSVLSSLTDPTCGWLIHAIINAAYNIKKNYL